jgi:TonB family protein
MTNTRPVYAGALSANDAFKLQYPKYIKGSILGALALIALFTWLWPGYQAKPYKIRESQAFEIVNVEPPPEVIELPKVMEVPRIPPVIEVADPGDTDVDPVWPLDPWDIPIDPAPYTPPDDTGFVASSSLPQLLQHAKADYPEIARRSGLEGTVVVSVLVNPRGNVEKAQVIQSAHPILDRAALEAAARCRFTPAKQREIAVRAWVAIPYRFRLK